MQSIAKKIHHCVDLEKDFQKLVSEMDLGAGAPAMPAQRQRVKLAALSVHMQGASVPGQGQGQDEVGGKFQWVMLKVQYASKSRVQACVSASDTTASLALHPGSSQRS